VRVRKDQSRGVGKAAILKIGQRFAPECLTCLLGCLPLPPSAHAYVCLECFAAAQFLKGRQAEFQKAGRNS
jgi:hypothetical protein